MYISEIYIYIFILLIINSYILIKLKNKQETQKIKELLIYINIY